MEKEKELNKEMDVVTTDEKEKNQKPEQTVENTEKKVTDIIKKSKEKGNITYGELASQLGDINPEQIDKVFDVMEEMGVDVLKDDMDEPDIDELEEVEDLKLDDIDSISFEGISTDDPVRMYLREIR